MTDRRLDAILRDWREAERDRAHDDENADLSARVQSLRSEHDKAVHARRDVARDLASDPQAPHPAGTTGS